MSNIQKVSQWFKWLFQLMVIAMPILLMVFWIDAPSPVSSAAASYGMVISYIPKGINIIHPLSAETKLLGFVISLIPLTVQMFVLYFLIRLFRSYEKCDIFSYKNVCYIKYIGIALFVGQIFSPIYQALLSAALTWHNPHGERYVHISFSGVNLGILLTALMVILISWIIAEGYKLKEDQRYTI